MSNNDDKNIIDADFDQLGAMNDCFSGQAVFDPKLTANAPVAGYSITDSTVGQLTINPNNLQLGALTYKDSAITTFQNPEVVLEITRDRMFIVYDKEKSVVMTIDIDNHTFELGEEFEGNLDAVGELFWHAVERAADISRGDF